MSLDVWLTAKYSRPEFGTGVYVREKGAQRELTPAEVAERFPDHEPIAAAKPEQTFEVFDWNITHNLNRMAQEAGLYSFLWRPDETGITHAYQLIEPLAGGLELLKSDPDRFRAFNPANGWGDYEGLVEFVAAYLAACQEHPQAEIGVSR